MNPTVRKIVVAATMLGAIALGVACSDDIAAQGPGSVIMQLSDSPSSSYTVS
jgi:hypothetical protein